MKSMSIVSYGISSLYCVANWHSGLVSCWSPWMYDLEGEKVCAQVMMPAHSGSAFAAANVAEITSLVSRLGLRTTSKGISFEALR